MKIHSILLGFLVAAVAILPAGCKSVDDDRIPRVPVRIQFQTMGDWITYGVGGAGETRRFILATREPAGFPYTSLSATGYGGVLLVCDYDGQYRVFDLACPVECRPTVRINVIMDSGTPRGECPECHSTYDVFRWGGPLGGTAARKGYGLTHYVVGPGLNGEAMLITN
ncbi:MAG: hypothetical protein NC336_03210 [Clostridium sp.]|nr:hypothetical protein [Clostridium sp.]